MRGPQNDAGVKVICTSFCSNVKIILIFEFNDADVKVNSIPLSDVKLRLPVVRILGSATCKMKPEAFWSFVSFFL